MLCNDDEFNSFTVLCDKVMKFEWSEGVQLYIRRSRSHISSKAIFEEKDYNENIKYDKIEHALITYETSFILLL